MTSVISIRGGGSVVMDSKIPVHKRGLDEEKPRHIYRIRKTDYVKLPPIEREVSDVCLHHDTIYEDKQHVHKYIDDLVPDVNSCPAPLRTTLKSPMGIVPDIVLVPEISLWMIANLNRRKARCLHFSSNSKLGNFNPHPFDLNKDLLEKEVEIKRILEQHRPTLLRSLKKLRRRKDKSAELEDEGQGTTGMAITICDLDSNESYPGRSSSLRDSALGDSAFGLWEGNTEPDTEYLPSSRTLMTGLTGEQERSTILHSLTENGRKKAPSLEGSDSDTEIFELAETDADSSRPAETVANIRNITQDKEIIAPEKKESETKVKLEDKESKVSKSDNSTKILQEKEFPVEPTPKKQNPYTPPSPRNTIPKSATPQTSLPAADVVEDEVTIPAQSELTNQPDQPSPHETSLPASPTKSKSSSKTEEDETPVPQCPSDDILGIDAMLADLDSDKEENKESSDDENIMVQGEGIPEQDESESVEVPDSVEETPEVTSPSPPPRAPEKTPTPPPAEKSPTPPPPPPQAPVVRVPTPAPPTPIILSPIPPPKPKEKKPLKKPPQPRMTMKRLNDDDLIANRKAEAMERAKLKSREREKQRQMELEAAALLGAKLQGDENIHQILERFTIVDKARLNYLFKIFHDCVTEEEENHLSHQGMKRALLQIKTCTKISRNQLKYIELILELNKKQISFHTFAVMATLIDHMTHKDPSTLAMFDSIDLTRLEHDLPRLKRLFHCVCEKDDMGWPILTTLALEIELRAYCVPENTRNRIIKELDPENRGEITIFDFILFTPLWIHLHDGIVDNPFREIERDISSPAHRKWGVSALWLPENAHNVRDAAASPASGCGSERSTPDTFLEEAKMRAAGGEPTYSSSEDEDDDDTEGIANSDDEDD